MADRKTSTTNWRMVREVKDRKKDVKRKSRELLLHCTSRHAQAPNLESITVYMEAAGDPHPTHTVFGHG